MYPQKNEAGIVQKMAIEVITPRATKGPPIMLVSWKVITYKGMNTESNPNAISWKKKPSRHIAKSTFQRGIKTFSLNKVKTPIFF
jgi:hypothetical protein